MIMNQKQKLSDFYYAKSPANIAFIKYWGRDNNKIRWPHNSSLSMTLTNSFTITATSEIKTEFSKILKKKLITDYLNYTKKHFFASNDFIDDFNNLLAGSSANSQENDNDNENFNNLNINYIYHSFKDKNYLIHILFVDFFCENISSCSLDFEIKNFSHCNLINKPNKINIFNQSSNYGSQEDKDSWLNNNHLNLKVFQKKLENQSNDFNKLTKMKNHIDFLNQQLNLKKSNNNSMVIITANSFPSNCGLASSASGFSALSLSYLANRFQSRTVDDLCTKHIDIKKIAYLSGQGSGSAGRSLWSGYVSWNKSTSCYDQFYQKEFTADHLTLLDIIIVVNYQAKTVSSSDGHLSAASSKYHNKRIQKDRIEHMMAMMIAALKDKNIKLIAKLAEDDCKDMHKIMKTQNMSCDYIKDDTKDIINSIEFFKKKHDLELFYTLDAGPNIHLICTEKNYRYILDYLVMRHKDQIKFLIYDYTA